MSFFQQFHSLISLFSVTFVLGNESSCKLFINKYTATNVVNTDLLQKISIVSFYSENSWCLESHTKADSAEDVIKSIYNGLIWRFDMLHANKF